MDGQRPCLQCRDTLPAYAARWTWCSCVKPSPPSVGGRRVLSGREGWRRRCRPGRAVPVSAAHHWQPRPRRLSCMHSAGADASLRSRAEMLAGVAAAVLAWVAALSTRQVQFIAACAPRPLACAQSRQIRQTSVRQRLGPGSVPISRIGRWNDQRLRGRTPATPCAHAYELPCQAPRGGLPKLRAKCCVTTCFSPTGTPQ